MAKLRKEWLLWNLQTFLSKNTLQNLIDVKSEWATFWALSNEELRMLQAASNGLSGLAKYDKFNPTELTWFKGSESKIQKELQKIIDVYDETIKNKERLIWRESTWTNEDDLFDSLYN